MDATYTAPGPICATAFKLNNPLRARLSQPRLTPAQSIIMNKKKKQFSTNFTPAFQIHRQKFELFQRHPDAVCKHFIQICFENLQFKISRKNNEKAKTNAMDAHEKKEVEREGDRDKKIIPSLKMNLRSFVIILN